MQHLEVSGAVRLIYGSLGFKGLTRRYHGHKYWVRESSEGGRNLDLNERPVSTTQNLKRYKLTNILKKNNSEINVQPIKRLK